MWYERRDEPVKEVDMKPLQDLLVVDLTRVLAGPYATMVMRNLGARVIKVERPVVGDDSRHFGPFHGEESAYFASINAGKESMTLDLKSPRGKEILRALVTKADVLVENYKPGVMEKLGLGWDRLHELNPRLIYAASSGFGHSGPLSQRPAYDMIVQAAGGLMSITGSPEPGAPPVRVGTSIGDITAALFTAIGIMGALVRRSITGMGQKIDVAMLDSQVAILENAVVRYGTSGEVPGPLGTAHPSITPFQGFETADGWIIVAVGNDKLWALFADAMGHPEWLEREEWRTNDMRTADRDVLVATVAAVFLERSASDWYEILDGAGIPVSPINTVDRVLSHPQVLARNMVVETRFADGVPLRIAGNPIKMSELEETATVPVAPALGEHTEALLKEFLDLDGEGIAALRAEGVI